MSKEIYVVNQDYGNGYYRRRIRISSEKDSKQAFVRVELEDSCHGFKLNLFHNQQQVTAITCEFVRFPFTTCNSADAPLQALVGVALNSKQQTLNQLCDPKNNCTHLYDMAVLAIQHTQGKEKEVLYEVEVRDAQQGVSNLSVWRNGELIHQWQVQDNHVLSPAQLKNQPLFKGFKLWSENTFTGLTLEAAQVLQKGNLVATARMFDFDKMAGNTAAEESTRHVCHSFSPQHGNNAVRLAGTQKDFSNNREGLLGFE